MMETRDLILVIGEVETDQLSLFTRELLTLGKRIAFQTGKKLGLILLGNDLSSTASGGFQYGADHVYIGESDRFEHYIGEDLQATLAPVVEKFHPALLMLPHNDWGLDLAPRLAFQLSAKVVTDCDAVTVDGESDFFIFVKPIFGGKAAQEIHFSNPSLQIATIREGAVSEESRDEARTGEVEKLSIPLDGELPRVQFLKKDIDENLASASLLQTSNIVIAAGRGMKNSEGVDLAQKAATLLGAAIAGSRPVVDNGWLPYSLQIGLTGKKIHPRLYIAAGISGAIQHMVGCVKSGIVIGINTDPNAPVFKFSTYGIVGDSHEVLKGLINELE